jgi:autotransporter-associated beta strand protein
MTAADYTWDGGGGDNNWNTTANWVSGNPNPPGNANATDVVTFTGNVRTTANNNHPADSNMGITFNSGAGAFTLTGNSIDLFAGGAILNQSANNQTINLNVRARGSANNITNDGTGILSLATMTADTVNTSGNEIVGTLTISGTGRTNIGTISQEGTAANDALSLAKNGAGTLTLTGNNNYTGTTQVSAGTLVINGNQNAATGAVTVSNAGTRLSGTGTVGGASTTIGSGAIHAPGAVGAVGTQTFDRTGAATSNLTYQANSIFEWNMDRTQTQTRGNGYDAVNVTGTVGGTGAIFRIVIGDSAFNQAFWSISRTWTDIFQNGSGGNQSWTGIFGGGFQYYDTSGNPISGGVGSQGAFSFSGNNTLNWVPNGGATFIPEPTSALAGLLIVGGLLRRRR